MLDEKDDQILAAATTVLTAIIALLSASLIDTGVVVWWASGSRNLTPLLVFCPVDTRAKSLELGED
jgi:hypothetical protein